MVLITGASGFIGEHLKEILPNFMSADILHGCDIFELTDLSDYEAVIHLAAVSSVPKSWEDPTETYRTNIMGTQHLLNLKPKKIIFASSGSVVDPISPYALSKKVGEQIIRMSGVPHCILRLANVFGEGDDKSAIMHFQNSDTIKINGDGSQVRSYVYVKDVARAFQLALNLEGQHHIGGQTYSINEVAAMFDKPAIRTHTYPSPETHTYSIVFGGMPGWEPTVSLEDYLSRTES